jgi:hypothetical protein
VQLLLISVHMVKDLPMQVTDALIRDKARQMHGGQMKTSRWFSFRRGEQPSFRLDRSAVFCSPAGSCCRMRKSTVHVEG